MSRIRVIPTLLLQGTKLVKTKKFKDPIYIGDPRNAVKIFNDKKVDELVLLDINATIEKRSPNFDFINEIVSEAFMPIGYGGGITSLQDIEKLFRNGVEKIIVNACAIHKPELIKEAAEQFGNQSIVVSIDIKKNFWGKYHVFSNKGSIDTKLNPVEFAKKMEDLGAGEILLTAIEKEGSMEGYDLNILKHVTQAVSIPVVANGGAGTISHFQQAVTEGGASAVTAGSMFVFHGKLRGILINYPSQSSLKELLYSQINLV
jgi:imidazole glycerol-phosphate synthase subunit HisF